MAEHSAESMKFKVTQLKNDNDTEYNRDFRILSLDKILAWIDKKDYDETVKKELKRMIKSYPHSAYATFGKNFQKHLAAAQKAARKNRPMFVGELGDSNYKKLDSLDGEFKAPEPKINPENKPTLPSVKSVKNDFDDLDFLDDDVCVEKKHEENKNEILKQELENLDAFKSKVSRNDKENIAVSKQEVNKKDIVEDNEEKSLPYGLHEISEKDILE